MSQIGKFVTGNTELSAFLMASNHRLTETVVRNGRAEFTFGDNPNQTVRESVADFAAGAAINAKSLLESLRLLKSLAKDSVASSSRS